MAWYFPAACFLANVLVLVGGARLLPRFRRWRDACRRDAEEQRLMDYYKNGSHHEDAFVPPRHVPRKNGQNLR